MIGSNAAARLGRLNPLLQQQGLGGATTPNTSFALGAVGEANPGRSNPVGAIAPAEPQRRGVFDRIGSFLESDDGRAAMLRAGAATLQGGIGAGISAGAEFMDDRRRHADLARRWQMGHDLDAQKVAATTAAAGAKTAEDRRATIASVSAALRGMPADQRQAAMATYGPLLQQQGINPAEIETSDMGLEARITMGGTAAQAYDRAQPQTITPQAGASVFEAKPFGGGYRDITTNGSAPAPSPQSAPRVGEVRNGYRFSGGDAGDRRNWTKVGGATPAGSRGFP